MGVGRTSIGGTGGVGDKYPLPGSVTTISTTTPLPLTSLESTCPEPTCPGIGSLIKMDGVPLVLRISSLRTGMSVAPAPLLQWSFAVTSGGYW